MITQFEALKRRIFGNPNVRVEKTIDDEYIVLSGKQKLLKVYYSAKDVSTVYVWDNKENRFNPIATTQADCKQGNLFDITDRDILDMYYKCLAVSAAQGLPTGKVLPRALTASEKVVFEQTRSFLRQR